MNDDISILFDRIRVLLQDQGVEQEVGTDAVEHTLTDGYARALALEVERLRLEEEIRRLAGSDQHVGEVRILKVRHALLEDELAQLRGLLGSLSGRR